MNMFELQERLKDFSQEQLVREMQAPSGTAPQYMVLSELQRRSRMKQAFDAQQAQGAQSTVAEDAVNAAGLPQGGLADMARAMAPQSDIAGNTGVAPVARMQEGGETAGMSRYEEIRRRMQESPGLRRLLELGVNLSDSIPDTGMPRRADPPRVVRDPYDDVYPDSSDIPDAGRSWDDLEMRGFDRSPQRVNPDNMPEALRRDRVLELNTGGEVRRMQEGSLAVGPNAARLEEIQRLIAEAQARNQAIQEMVAAANAGGSPITTAGAYADLIGAPGPGERLTVAAGPPAPPLTDVPAELPIPRAGAPLSARPAELMDMVPEPDVTPFEFPSIAAGGEADPTEFRGRRVAPITNEGRYTEEDLAGVSPGRGGIVPLPEDYSPLDPFRSAGGASDARGERARREAEARAEREAAAAAEAAAADAARFEEEAAAADRETAALPDGMAPRVDLGGEEDSSGGGTGGGAGGGSGTGGGLAGIDRMMEQDKWLALAQFGLGLMSSTQPTLGGAIGEAGTAALGQLRESRQQAIERDLAERTLAARMAASSSSARDRSILTASEALSGINDLIESTQLAMSVTASPDERMRLADQLAMLQAQAEAIYARSGYGPGTAAAVEAGVDLDLAG